MSASKDSLQSEQRIEQDERPICQGCGYRAARTDATERCDDCRARRGLQPIAPQQVQRARTQRAERRNETLDAGEQIAAAARAAEHAQRRWELSAELMLVLVDRRQVPGPVSAARRAVAYADALLAELERPRG